MCEFHESEDSVSPGCHFHGGHRPGNQGKVRENEKGLKSSRKSQRIWRKEESQRKLREF